MSVNIKYNLRTAEAQAEIHSALFAATQEVFELDIKAMAKDLSPVKTGHNKRTIDTSVHVTPSGVRAELYTQSGYGGYLELGTRYMSARPYLWPAFNEFVDDIPIRMRGKF